MRQVVLTMLLLVFSVSAVGRWEVLGQGGQPIALGGIPMADQVLVTGDMNDFILRHYGTLQNVFY